MIKTSYLSLPQRIPRVRPGEGRRTWLLCLQLFAASGIFVLGRTVRDTLFLSRYDVTFLPWMFVLFGITAALTALWYGRYRGSHIPLAPPLCHKHRGNITYLIVWLLIRENIAWVYPFFYVWAEVVANLFILQFWTLAADLESPREARRLNSLVGAARPLGTIFFAVSAAWMVIRIGTEQLIFVLMSLMGLFAACVFLLRHEPRHNLRADSDPAGAGSRRNQLQTKVISGHWWRCCWLCL